MPIDSDSAPPDIAQCIVQVSRAHMGALVAMLGRRGFDDFTPSFAAVMPYIDERGIRATALAQQLGVTKQAMSQLVREMEKRCYLERVADPKDSRARLVRLTRRGLAVKKTCHAIRAEFTRSARAALGNEGVGALRAGLASVIEAFERLQT